MGIIGAIEKNGIMRGLGDGLLLSRYREKAGYVMTNRKERFARCYNWTDAKKRQGFFFWEGKERRRIFRTKVCGRKLVGGLYPQ